MQKNLVKLSLRASDKRPKTIINLVKAKNNFFKKMKPLYEPQLIQRICHPIF